MVNTAAKNLNKAVKEYKNCLTLVGTRPHIVFIFGQGFVTSYYYSKEFLQKHGWPIYKEFPKTLRLIRN